MVSCVKGNSYMGHPEKQSYWQVLSILGNGTQKLSICLGVYGVKNCGGDMYEDKYRENRGKLF